ncbi:MAG TPA: hemolysin III family protein [Longimicrobiales bacterium]
MNRQHWKNEWANTATHGLGVAASVVALCILVVFAARGGDAWEIVGVSIFGATLVLLYLASTLYHAAAQPHLKARLKVFDHSAIYLLIAGTYTPFMIGILRGGWGWSMFGVIWGLAVAGVVFKLFFTGRFPKLSTLIYILMGWLVLIAAVPMFTLIPRTTLTWLVIGGVTYTAGTLFYHNERLRHAHAIWHLFVLGGSVCHAIAVATAL